MNPTRLILLPVLLLSLLPVLLSGAGDFADQLFDEGDFPSAVLEYKRCLSDGMDSRADSLHAVRRIATAFYLNNDLPNLLGFARRYRELLAEGEQMRRLSALANIRQGYYVLALRELDTVREPESLVLRGLTREFMNETELAQTDYAAAGEALARDPSLLEEARRIGSDLAALKYKNPYLAAALGVIPGAGYLYAGRYETALSSLLLNSALLLASAELYRNKLVWTSGLTFTVALGFYLGNIYGSATTVLQDNRAKRLQYLQDFFLRHQTVFF